MRRERFRIGRPGQQSRVGAGNISTSGGPTVLLVVEFDRRRAGSAPREENRRIRIPPQETECPGSLRALDCSRVDAIEIDRARPCLDEEEPMTAAVRQHPRKKDYSTDDARWAAVASRDSGADNKFVYSVKTTGVYCRPSCKARLARRENVAFHRTPDEAEREGFRPCKRCRPRESSAHLDRAAMVAKACRLIVEAEETLSLNDLAESLGMSPYHFHRVFKMFTGLTPKAYAMAHRADRMRKALMDRGTVTSAIYDAGFGSNGRFYAESKKRLGMKPTAFKAGGEGATIRFAVGESSLGSILVAASDLGVCSISLGDDPRALVQELQDRFPNAHLVGADKLFEQWVAEVVAFVENPSIGLHLPLHVQGTAFQQRVWQALSEIPSGTTATYSDIARKLGQPSATRAVAGACAANNLAVAIPCHRVVRTDGSLSGYRWGVERKERLLHAEGSR
ncbi:MAG TPA: bifunctional DNA-binding transcriptional regulator/O6-methylguanine-DNA methyltransferase Ada [Tepidisphaeraceae bacterium]|jgi:AraC family transcriptional regulator of adaptative response/methylated-DNA-[protein]-cysteine methyltransferase